ncbi:right-handed parallel beta-helix repeat-containing protein [Paenibacillus eucommiae]|uniref:Parallel beta-helix repeat protein n=1 Tax=Paenibacillus eucommiae TaxID=1355755 RepID=A0ABS4IXS0_9BACL|nr:right-handed parallel beta-helix repeat-containing protein [Paenibacillus eucommiae]MBP1991885.1 parallel beta-helix repeat protein [Paenibacillus eucommiae]
MSNEEDRNLSRRKFVSLMGVAGLAAAGLGVAASTLQPRTAEASIGNAVERIADIATLRATGGEYDGQLIEVVSYYNTWATDPRGPVGGGCFIWSSASTIADNGGTVFKVTGITTGRWIRQNVVCVTPEMFGSVCGGADDTQVFVQMFAAALPVELGPYTYIVAPKAPAGEHQDSNHRGSLFKPKCSVRGVPGKTVLQYFTPGTDLQGYFLALRDVVGITIEGIHFYGGDGGIIIDPLQDHSVSDISIINCKFESQDDIAICCGRQIALDVNSKKNNKIKIRGCTFKTIGGHAVVVTNARDAIVTGNFFDGVWAGEGINAGGFCIDVSQGVRGCVVSNNVARNSTYFIKTESYTVTNSTDDACLTTDVVIANNECIDMLPVYQSGSYVNGFAILINSRSGNVIIEGNRLTYNKGNGIYIYSSSASDGAVQVRGNLIVQTDAGNYPSSGIYCSPDSSKRAILQGNTVHGFYNGIVCDSGKMIVNNNDVIATKSAIAVWGSTEILIEGNDLSGETGVVFANATTQFYKRVRFCHNRVKATTGSCLDLSYASNPIGCMIQGNVLEKTGDNSNPALYANGVESAVISGNVFHVPSRTSKALGLFLTTQTSILRDNLTNGIHQIVATDLHTLQEGNLTEVSNI